MEILINDTAIAVGEMLPHDAVATAGLQPVDFWSKLRGKHSGRQARLAAVECTIELFAGEFRIYPCTHGYLNRDRQWQTAAEIQLEHGRVRRICIRIVDGRYAAPGFFDRFNELCAERLGEPHAADRRSSRWHNGTLRFSSKLLPDRMNADLVVELAD